MRATRLAVTGLAAGTMVLGLAGPALATTVSKPVTPGAFCDKAGEYGRTKAGTLMICKTKPGDDQLRWRKAGPGDKPDEPSPTPTKPDFKFGFDKVQLSTRVVRPGGKTVFTVTCPNTVTITGNGYTKSPLAVKKIGEGRWRATGIFRSSLPDPTKATVVCKGFGSVTYSVRPEKGDTGMKPNQPKIPVGRINTGDGSMYGQSDGSAAPFLAAGWGALMALGLGAVALRRRTVRERP